MASAYVPSTVYFLCVKDIHFISCIVNALDHGRRKTILKKVFQRVYSPSIFCFCTIQYFADLPPCEYVTLINGRVHGWTLSRDHARKTTLQKTVFRYIITEFPGRNTAEIQKPKYRLEPLSFFLQRCNQLDHASSPACFSSWSHG